MTKVVGDGVDDVELSAATIIPSTEIADVRFGSETERNERVIFVDTLDVTTRRHENGASTAPEFSRKVRINRAACDNVTILAESKALD